MVNVIQGGCAVSHTPAFRMTRAHGLPHFVLLIPHTYGEFLLDGNFFSVRPHVAILIAPHTPNAYSNPRGTYTDDWMHFSVEDEQLKKRLCAISNVPIPLSEHRLYSSSIHQILWERSYGDETNRENIDALCNVLFNHLFSAYKKNILGENGKPYQEQLKALRIRMKDSLEENITVSDCATSLHISESYFQYLYKEQFGISFQQDLIRMRVEKAQFALASSNLPIREIGAYCGYHNEVHFHRQFKQHTGMTPNEYRRRHILTEGILSDDTESSESPSH